MRSSYQGWCTVKIGDGSCDATNPMQPSTAQATHFQFATQYRSCLTRERRHIVELVDGDVGVDDTISLRGKRSYLQHTLCHCGRRLTVLSVDKIINSW
jgi:hypothetical protein